MTDFMKNITDFISTNESVIRTSAESGENSKALNLARVISSVINSFSESMEESSDTNTTTDEDQKHNLVKVLLLDSFS